MVTWVLRIAMMSAGVRDGILALTKLKCLLRSSALKQVSGEGSLGLDIPKLRKISHLVFVLGARRRGDD